MSAFKDFFQNIGLYRNSSKLKLNLETFGSPDERYFGLVNFGNTCYCNSVLQALYFCKSFRDRIICETPLNAATKLYNITIKITSEAENGAISNVSLRSSSSFSETEGWDENGNVPIKPGSAQMPHRVSSKRSMGSNSSARKIFAKTSFPAQESLQLSANLDADAADSSLYKTIPESAQTKQLLEFVSRLSKEESLLTCLQELFLKISTMKKRHGFVSPSSFIARLKKENEMFRSSMHQDAHEFLNYLLNDISETLTRRYKDIADRVVKCFPHLTLQQSQRLLNKLASLQISQTAVHAFFEGTLTNETRCLTCETVTSKNESFLELSVNVEPHSSIGSCLKSFSAVELLDAKNKFFCDKCRSLQSAEKRLKVKRLPAVLAVHLKRFKYQEDLKRYIKVSHEVLFSNQLKLSNNCIDPLDANRVYNLVAIVVHIGAALHHGHYVTLLPPSSAFSVFDPDAKGDSSISKRWLLFDDDVVEFISDADIWRIVGGDDKNVIEDKPLGDSWAPQASPGDVVKLKDQQSEPSSDCVASNSDKRSSGVKGTGYLFFYQQAK